jgi:hypothetical protein
MEPAQPVVSIVIPVFNREALIVETLDSLSRQTFNDWEAIVVDDGSTDGSRVAISRRATLDSRVRLLHRERGPKGANNCRNLGLTAARSALVIFLDSDDLLAPHCLQQRLAIMRENPRLDCAVFQGSVFRQTPGDTDQIWNLPSEEPDLPRFLRGESVWQTAGSIWKKSAVQALGGWDEMLTCWQDVDLHVRALVKGLVYVRRLDLLPDYLYRWHPGQSVSQGRSRDCEHVAGLLKLCAKLAISPGPNRTAGEKAGLQFIFAKLIFLALDNELLEVGREAIRLAQEHGITPPSAKFIWPLALTSYQMRACGLRGFAWLGEHMLLPYLPPPYTFFSKAPPGPGNR